MKILGLVGGMSWVSTIDYYRLINEGVNQRLGGVEYAECIIYSVNFNDFQKNNTANDWDATFHLLYNACDKLQKAGADAIVLCANTAHAVAGRLKQHFPLPLIDIIEETANAVGGRGLKRVALLGTKFTMEMDFYREGLLARGIAPQIPPSQEDRDYIQQTLKEELGRGILLEETRQKYLSIIRSLIADGAEGIILGCTEIPQLIGQQDVPVPVFDTTRIHSEAAVRFALS